MNNLVTQHDFTSLAVPSEEDQALWQSMTREEQIEILQNHFAQIDCSEQTDKTIQEIMDELQSTEQSSEKNG